MRDDRFRISVPLCAIAILMLALGPVRAEIDVTAGDDPTPFNSIIRGEKLPTLYVIGGVGHALNPLGIPGPTPVAVYTADGLTEDPSPITTIIRGEKLPTLYVIGGLE